VRVGGGDVSGKTGVLWYAPQPLAASHWCVCNVLCSIALPSLPSLSTLRCGCRCAVLYALLPAAFRTVQCHVAVETVSPHTAGQTIADLKNTQARPASDRNVTVALAMDSRVYWRSLLRALVLADAASPANAGAGMEAAR